VLVALLQAATSQENNPVAHDTLAQDTFSHDTIAHAALTSPPTESAAVPRYRGHFTIPTNAPTVLEIAPPTSPPTVFCPGLPSGGYDQTCSLCTLDKACILTCIDCGGSSSSHLWGGISGEETSPISATCDLSLGCRSVIDDQGVLECSDGQHYCRIPVVENDTMSDTTMIATALCVLFLGSLVMSTCHRAVNQNCGSLLSLMHLSPYHEVMM
jgi:hypothetical protein